MEEEFDKLQFSTRALYLPYGLMQQFTDDLAFKNMFHEAVDIYAIFSPVPGAFTPSDRPSSIQDLSQALLDTDRLLPATWLTPTQFYVVRKNMGSTTEGAAMNNAPRYFPERLFDRTWDSQNLAVFSRRYPTPLIYTPTYRRVAPSGFDEGEITRELGGVRDGVATIMPSQNPAHADAVGKFVAEGGKLVGLEFRRLNPTKYRIRLHGASGKVPLVFGEGFSRGWKLYPVAYHDSWVTPLISYAPHPGNERFQATLEELREFINSGRVSVVDQRNESTFVSKEFQGSIQNDALMAGNIWETWSADAVAEQNHLRVNGYANGWVIDTADVCATTKRCKANVDGTADVELVMEFWPQQLFYLGVWVSASTLIAVLWFILFRYRNGARIRPTIDVFTAKSRLENEL